MKNFNIFNNYCQNYKSYEKTFSYPFSKKNFFSEFCNVLYYEGQGDEVFLVVPSIFNSYEILTLGTPLDMITHLRTIGSVYLIEWLEVKDKNFGLDDYAAEIAKALNEYGSVHLIGHCLGGNFAVAAANIHPNKVKSLILLTTPWDFEHFVAPKALYNTLGLAKAIEGLDHIPPIYMQILFFLLSPESFEQKLDYYQANKEDMISSNFFDVERWQFSGHSIPRKAYDDLVEKFIDNNILVNNLWVVDEATIDPAKLDMPIMTVICNKDRLVPKSSGGILFGLSKVFEYNSGHIGYLVGSQRILFFKDLLEWVSGQVKV